MPPPVPFAEIVEEWLIAGMEPAACRRAVERASANGMPEGLLDPVQVTAGGIVATDELLYLRCKDQQWLWSLGSGAKRKSYKIAVDDAATVAELVRIAARARSRAQALEAAADYLDDAELIEAFASALEDHEDHGTWPTIEKAGVYRREHASLVLRSVDGTVIVTDPQRLTSSWTTNNGAYPAEPQWLSANVLVTHSHGDHFDLASIVSYASDEHKVVLPRVEVPSLLCDNLETILGCVGQRSLTPAWWERLELNDITVDVLPFYGEQPTRTLPLPPMVRNWGNCYRFQLNGWSLAILVDSGQDAEGNMVDVLERSVAEHGPIDVLMSCCFSFPEMLNLGLPKYAFTVPFETLRAHFRTRGSITSGPTGVAAACRAARARYFLPYAHGFTRLHHEPTTAENATTEHAALAAVSEELSRLGCSTEVLSWNPGSWLGWRDGNAVVENHSVD